ncbi:prepilin-type N-terminal cleavage/methylation domain [Rubrobacter radiotolerans]|nr:prepilin-type N-terminal cleavage/methylation domain [Rubrobacter radiotolerans]SMC06547.1 prepilin-type N-terminal cleavage/methylation domain-containing protein [Rubrobacter radiotolerans DSM 5868]
MSVVEKVPGYPQPTERFRIGMPSTQRPDHPGERGFSLVELLVVVVIIGILSAIAIPTFLAQREQAQSAAVQSDLRNAATAASSCSSENDGSYASCNLQRLRSDYDFNPTDGVTLSGVVNTATRWAAEGRHTANPSATVHHFDTETGSQVRPGPKTPGAPGS